MFKLFIMGVIANTLSDLTGIPVFPVFLKIEKDQIAFELSKVDENKFDKFNKYVRTKFYK